MAARSELLHGTLEVTISKSEEYHITTGTGIDRIVAKAKQRFIQTMRAIQVWGLFSRFFSPLGEALVVGLLVGLFLNRFPVLENCVDIGIGMLLVIVLSKLWPTMEAILSTKLSVAVDLEDARGGRTRLDHITIRWNVTHHIYCAHEVSKIRVTVQANQPSWRWVKVGVTLEEILSGDVIVLLLPFGVHSIQVKLQFINVERDREWGNDFWGVVDTYFPERQRCEVSLYQDAHIPHDFSPEIALDGGRPYQPQRCWEDIFNAINDAKHVIYIIGWSLHHNITLVRDRNRQNSGLDIELGDLLRRKAQQGVTVLILIWNDLTSIMHTRSRETVEYFRGTGVHCVACTRRSDGGGFSLKPLMYSHHQKTVVVDVKSINSDKREIVAFVGGIDLCDGRYDTPHHLLFSTLNSEHEHDFYQPNFPDSAIEKGGPREPWHDIHARVEGPAAWDILRNFEQRWTKQGEKHVSLRNLDVSDIIPEFQSQLAEDDDEDDGVSLRNLEVSDIISESQSQLAEDDDVSLRNLDVSDIIPESQSQLAEDDDVSLRNLDVSDIIPESQSQLVEDDDEDNDEAWNVQVFRSIDGGVAAELPNDYRDRSIQNAYINAIRCAKNFIYIETQFFLGSSFAWAAESGVNLREVSVLNLIPKELSLKIVSKIRNDEPFNVYIVLPMWPEGDPEDWMVQEILDSQRRTMQMMYADVVGALKNEEILGADPRDYLTFFCLGNREQEAKGTPKEHKYDPPPERPKEDSNYMRAQQARRFMIYVHSKMMIVDDEYIIIGSSNINERSMDGARDSEIAIGAYQPKYLASNSNNNLARGHIHCFRKSLWFEHLRKFELCFDNPGTKECVKKVNQLADDNWKDYSQPEPLDLSGHLLRYPVNISKEDGTITALEGHECFPDTNAPILGRIRDDVLSRLLDIIFLRRNRVLSDRV